MSDPATMSSKELKALIVSAGLKFNDCVEKSDFVARAKEAQKVLDAGGGAAKPAAAKPAATAASKVGNFDCIVLGDDDPDLVVVILHGYGATNADFRDIPRIMSSGLLPAGKKIRYFLPQAPKNSAGMTEW